MTSRGILCFALAVATAAQEPTFRAQSNLVTVPALIKNERGDPVYGLQATDFIIEDDGQEQPVQLDEAAEAEPVSMVVAVQCGRRAAREFPRMRGLGAMLNPVFAQPESQVALVEFDGHVTLAHDFTHDSDKIADALQRLEAGDGGAATLDAVQFSVRRLDRAPAGHRRVLLLISETRDHASKFTKIQDVVAAVGNSSTVVYALAFSPSWSEVLDTERGSNRDEGRSSGDLLAPLLMASQAIRRNTPKAVAGMTGGEYEMFSSRKSFERLMTEFTNHLQSRYLLRFEPKDPHPGLHEIRVRLRAPGKRTILARSSYWAKGER
jgi:VWFA-related protein